MKRQSHSRAGRIALATLLLFTGVVLTLLAIFTPFAHSANPAAGTIAAAGPAVSWDGTASGTGSANGESTCMDGINCDTFTLTVDPLSNWTGKRVEVRISWPTNTSDYDLVIHKTSNSGPIIDTSGNGPGIAEVGHINPAVDGTGVFTVHVVYFVNVPGQQFHGIASVIPLTPTPPPAAPVASGAKIGFENFEAPGLLTPVTTTTGPTVEYVGRNAGEPSIGINWNSNVTNFQSDLQTLFVSFANSCATGGVTATWANRPAPTSQVIDSDPIGFTDAQTGRAFAAELTATSPSCKISFTDNDGTLWAPTSGPLGSGIDHETIGGGPYHSPLVGTVYPHAVYYCSQDLVAAFCLRSDDGGMTWGAPVPTYTTECGGLHGHVKVSPTDGSVFLPNKACGAGAAVVVSENNGATWSIRPVGNASVQTGASESDPAVAIDAAGRVYFATADNDSSAVVATSTDNGATWTNIYSVSSAYGLQNIRYPAAVAGDAGRAAIAFLGSTTPGSANASTYNGVWHLYVTETFDGGASWTTTDVTPNTPIQRGVIWTGGGANIGRNLLDFFDIAIDKEGRVEIGYVNGCAGANCAQSSASATGNAYSATATIARQSSGRRLLSAFDPADTTTVPGMPWVSARRVGGTVHLAWSEADTGNSAITAYQILRGTTAGAESLFATIGGTQSNYDDLTAINPNATYFYKVVAVNAVGSSCANNEVSVPYVGDTCSGIIIHKNDPSHPESTAANAAPQLAIDYIKVGEPFQAGAGNFMFQMKVANLTTVPPNSRWRMVWDSYASPGQQFYVGMRSDANSVVTFDYGTIATAVVGLVVGVPQEASAGAALPASNYQADGTITIFVPKSQVGNPQPGDLLGAMNGRTFSGDTAETGDLERSTGLIDHTFVKAQTDNAFPAATYTVVGNSVCAIPAPVSAASVRAHAAAGTFSVPLPLVGNPGIEPRVGTPSGKDFQVVVTFPSAVTVSGVSVSSSDGTATATQNTSDNTVTVDLHNVANAQYLAITLLNVSDGIGSGNVSVPMGVLLGDVDASGRVDGGDVLITRQQNLQGVSGANFRADVNVSGRIDGGDVLVTRNQNLTGLPAANSSGERESKSLRTAPPPAPPMTTSVTTTTTTTTTVTPTQKTK